jgi:hypothetical protein
VVVTLATNYDSLRGVLAFPAAVLMYLGAVLIALVVSQVRRRGAWGLAVLWGLLYPVAQVFASGLAGGRDQIWLQTLGPSVLTALLLWWATQSWIVPVGCFVGWVATAITGPVLVRGDSQWLLAVPWNLCVGAALIMWAEKVRLRAESTDVCPRCGYPVRGLPGEVCPECGPRRVVPEGTCAKCGYDVSGVKGGVCPECGGRTK